MKKVLSVVLACALSLSLCSCSLFGGGKKSSPAKSSVEETTVAATLPENPTADDYVKAKIDIELPFEGDFQITGEKNLKNAKAHSRLPQLVMESDVARKINLEISANYESELQTYKQPADNRPMDRIDYVCYLNGKVLSLVIEHRTVEPPNSYFSVYNINTETGKTMSGDEVVALSETDINTMHKSVAKAINKVYDEMEKTAGSAATKKQIENARSVSTSDSNLESTEFFFNADKKLVVIYRYKGVNSGAIGHSVLAVSKVKMKTEAKSKK